MRDLHEELTNAGCELTVKTAASGYVAAYLYERQQKCRYNAFMFLLTGESKPFIKTLLINEVKARQGKVVL